VRILPRWLRSEKCVEDLLRHDESMSSEGRSGVVLIEVHYQHGVPLVAKVREMLLPVAVLHLRVAASS